MGTPVDGVGAAGIMEVGSVVCEAVAAGMAVVVEKVDRAAVPYCHVRPHVYQAQESPRRASGGRAGIKGAGAAGEWLGGKVAIFTLFSLLYLVVLQLRRSFSICKAIGHIYTVRLYPLEVTKIISI